MKHHVVFGVTGSIAAFKAAALASDMVKSDLDVRVVLTEGAARFVTPLTFEALTGYPVTGDTWEEQPGGSRMGHIELAKWADILIVAPATAQALARLALGFTDDLLSAVALATAAPLLIAPAMESRMFDHPATQEHLATLQLRGARIVGPESGRLASGAEGKGRMSEPEVILQEVLRLLKRTRDLMGKRVLVTAGPTYEPIDPVRFIGNRSSGKMGYAIAETAAERGAEVVLVSGPTKLVDPPGMRTIRVDTAEEMRQAVLHNIRGQDVVVMSAAVGDFRAEVEATEKLRRSEGMSLSLIPTADIAAEAVQAAPEAIHVGFALETRNLVAAARRKLERKGQDLVVANAATDSHSPFGSEANRVVFVTRDGELAQPEMSKRDVARRLWDEVQSLPRWQKSKQVDGQCLTEIG